MGWLVLKIGEKWLFGAKLGIRCPDIDLPQNSFDEVVLAQQKGQI